MEDSAVHACFCVRLSSQNRLWRDISFSLMHGKAYGRKPVSEDPEEGVTERHPALDSTALKEVFCIAACDSRSQVEQETKESGECIGGDEGCLETWTTCGYLDQVKEMIHMELHGTPMIHVLFHPGGILDMW
eukprot:7577489-Ditylum_brightwellii.AAC.1